MLIELTKEMAQFLLDARKYNKEFNSRRAKRLQGRLEYIRVMEDDDKKKVAKANFDRDKPELRAWGKWRAAEQDLGAAMFFIPVTDEQLREIVGERETENPLLLDEEIGDSGALSLEP